MSDTMLTQSTAQKPPLVGRMVLAVVLAAVAGLMFGLDIGVISGALGFITDEFHASETAQSWIVSSMMLGAAVGALCAGRTSSALGRRKSLTLSAFLFVLGALACTFAQSVALLIIGRAVLGLAIGIASYVAPLYISEIADEQRRGSLIAMYQLMITLGILLAFISDALFSYSHAWRWMFGVVAIPGAFFLIGSFFLPDSPRWLMLQGRHREAESTLAVLRSSPEHAHAEINDIRAQLTQTQRGLSLFLENPNFRRSVALGMGLQLVQQFTGMNVVLYYGPRIFGSAGFGQDGQMWGTAIVGLVNFLATFIAIGFVDRWGRRPMLVTGFAIMAAGLGALAVLLNAGPTSSDMLHYLSVAVLLCFITGFAFSAGPLVWTLCAEIQPLQGRDFGITCSTLTNWITNMIVGVTFLPMLSAFGSSKTFWIYAGLNALFILFTLFFVPETKGVTLESIERKLNTGAKLREIGR
ncbi:sugar porter family MFS transporter [Gluconobacter wancherniae]|uniref:MFS transporter n=1 Tax=Gluconobacter wancherniae NBRC 103581 TaxID=656744 RepID=A0A511B3F9_9PROT|nr:sugar porter family MFS transporter [Gluconobacter wancherniae]MBF0854121.1 sugar porter family MFS transporter [Gluconobacter wancherniae]GBD57177.1 MFS transporter [Gluconobacter wancherniae NBRC 103581]GBR65324.1 sugar-proton symporter [Gluconobacter wancherniae NBRC 103581]GEK94051.1 MFS transporter [Gluconobacter wancherniae NBRC 103581]